MVAQFKNSVLDEMLADIRSIGKDENLYTEIKFNLRLQAIDYIEFHIIDRLDALMESTGPEELNFLKKAAIRVKNSLEYVNTTMFNQLRKKVSQEDDKGQLLKNLIDKYLGHNLSESWQDAIGYDNLDIFLDGLLTGQNLPGETMNREPGMIYYQKTPARIILELIKRANFKPQDVFFDLGSGLGQVTILVNLLTSVISKGIEIEPAFCRYAKDCAADLNLADVDFVTIDARYADYSSGTFFFMYTPFEGKMLKDTLENLRGEAKKRKIGLFTFGPCTTEVAKQSWLLKSADIQNISGECCEFLST